LYFRSNGRNVFGTTNNRKRPISFATNCVDDGPFPRGKKQTVKNTGENASNNFVFPRLFVVRTGHCRNIRRTCKNRRRTRLDSLHEWISDVIVPVVRTAVVSLSRGGGSFSALQSSKSRANIIRHVVLGILRVRGIIEKNGPSRPPPMNNTRDYVYIVWSLVCRKASEINNNNNNNNNKIRLFRTKKPRRSRRFNVPNVRIFFPKNDQTDTIVCKIPRRSDTEQN